MLRLDPLLVGFDRPSKLRSGKSAKTLLAVGAALGISDALDETKVAHFVAVKLVSVARPFGAIAIYAAVYLATALLSSIIDNTAVIALTLPMVATLAAPENNVRF